MDRQIQLAEMLIKTFEAVNDAWERSPDPIRFAASGKALAAGLAQVAMLNDASRKVG